MSRAELWSFMAALAFPICIITWRIFRRFGPRFLHYRDPLGGFIRLGRLAFIWKCTPPMFSERQGHVRWFKTGTKWRVRLTLN